MNDESFESTAVLRNCEWSHSLRRRFEFNAATNNKEMGEAEATRHNGKDFLPARTFSFIAEENGEREKRTGNDKQ